MSDFILYVLLPVAVVAVIACLFFRGSKGR